MGFGLRRTDLQANAQRKFDDAIVLLGNKSPSNAYYLAGYAIELGLKACVAAQLSPQTIPDKAIIKRILDHNFNVLVGLAGLADELKRTQAADLDFAANWAVVSEWSPDARYETIDTMSAQTLVEAIGNDRSGVLKWIRTHW